MLCWIPPGRSCVSEAQAPLPGCAVVCCIRTCLILKLGFSSLAMYMARSCTVTSRSAKCVWIAGADGAAFAQAARLLLAELAPAENAEQTARPLSGIMAPESKTREQKGYPKAIA